MPWIILLASAVFEAVWATALGQSDGLSRPVPALVFFVALALSMLGLGWSLKHIPLGTAYAVWTGVGAALTVIWAMATGEETASAWKMVFLSGIIVAVVGLKLAPDPGRGDREPGAAGSPRVFTSPGPAARMGTQPRTRRRRSSA